MRLIDLDPRWLMQNDQRIGFVFRCPTDTSCWQSCFVTAPPRHEQWPLFVDALGGDQDDREMGRHDVQGCTPGTNWQIVGGIDVADFATLTVTPSLDGSRAGNWHGFITNGEIVGGI